MPQFFKAISKYIVIAIFSLTLTLTLTPQSFGQIPWITNSSNNQSNQSLPWALNKAYPCGRFWCSDVYVSTDSIISILSFPVISLSPVAFYP